MRLGVSDPKIIYKGKCLDRTGAHSGKNVFNTVSVEGYSECYENCKSAQNCAAFGFKTSDQSGDNNCDLYEEGNGGPYIKGSGDSAWICSIMPLGI